jgi:peptidoglycan/LPS O-acetylase OafA/YrhL
MRGQPIRLRGATLPTLDGVRGLAILLVMLHHFTQFHPPGEALATRVFFGLCDAGWMGVDLFFVLSGFLITSILLETKTAKRYFFSFYSRRTLRIFPLYYGALCLFFFVVPELHSPNVELAQPSTWWWYWLYATNVDIALHWWEPRGITHFWSLAVEEHFYLVWPLVVRWSGRHALLVVCVLTWILAAYLRVRLMDRPNAPLPGYVLTPTRLDLLTAGGALAILAHGPKGLEPHRAWLYALGGLGVVGLGVRVWALGSLDSMERNLWSQALTSAATGAVFVALVTLAVSTTRASLASKLLSSSWLRTFGRYSYGLYVFHLGVDELARHGVPAWGLSAHDARATGDILLAVIERMGATFAIAWLSYHLYERWFLELKPRIG